MMRWCLAICNYVYPPISGSSISGKISTNYIGKLDNSDSFCTTHLSIRNGKYDCMKFFLPIIFIGTTIDTLGMDVLFFSRSLLIFIWEAFVRNGQDYYRGICQLSFFRFWAQSHNIRYPQQMKSILS